MKWFIALFVLLLLAQGYFWQQTHDIIPDMSIVPEVPSETTVKATSFGDEQTFFRMLALQIQTAGDTYGRFTSLKKYDYNRLYLWFRLLDSLDTTSNYVPTMATYYYGQTPNTDDLRYIIDYLVEHSKDRLDVKWWWLTQAVYFSNHKLHNKERAALIAKQLIGAKGVPLWAQQLPAFIYEQQGEFEAAHAIMQGILDNQKDISPGELNFMRYFVEERLHQIERLNQGAAQKEAPEAKETLENYEESSDE